MALSTKRFKLLERSDYLAAPEGVDRFLYLEDIARSRLYDGLNETESTNQYNEALRSQYVGVVQGLLRYAGIPSISDYYDRDGNIDFENFMEQSAALVTEYSAKEIGSITETTLELSVSSRARLENGIQALRLAIKDSDLSESKKRSLFEKLEEIESDIRSNRRVNLGQILAGIAVIAVSIGGFTSFMADAPAALQNSISLIELLATEKSEEESVQETLKQHRRQLLGSPTAPDSEAEVSFENEKQDRLKAAADDNEIPF